MKTYSVTWTIELAAVCPASAALAAWGIMREPKPWADSLAVTDEEGAIVWHDALDLVELARRASESNVVALFPRKSAVVAGLGLVEGSDVKS